VSSALLAPIVIVARGPREQAQARFSGESFGRRGVSYTRNRTSTKEYLMTWIIVAAAVAVLMLGTCSVVVLRRRARG
jgi:hypothetical protein